MLSQDEKCIARDLFVVYRSMVKSLRLYMSLTQFIEIIMYFCALASSELNRKTGFLPNPTSLQSLLLRHGFVLSPLFARVDCGELGINWVIDSFFTVRRAALASVAQVMVL